MPLKLFLCCFFTEAKNGSTAAVAKSNNDLVIPVTVAPSSGGHGTERQIVPESVAVPNQLPSEVKPEKPESKENGIQFNTLLRKKSYNYQTIYK